MVANIFTCVSIGTPSLVLIPLRVGLSLLSLEAGQYLLLGHSVKRIIGIHHSNTTQNNIHSKPWIETSLCVTSPKNIYLFGYEKS